MVHIDFSNFIEKKLKPVHGMNNGPIWNGNNSQFNDVSSWYEQIGVPSIRLHDTNGDKEKYYVDISNVFPNFDAEETNPENYRFWYTDKLLEAIHKIGADVIYRLGESIEHAPKKYYAVPPKDFDKWARICVQIIRHYNDGWAEGYHYSISHWEIWNEPELFMENGKPDEQTMWGGGTMEQACELYRVAVTKIKSYDSSLKVGGMGFSAYNRYVEQFVCYCSKNNLPLDFYSYHSYSTNILSLKAVFEKHDRLLKKYGFSETEHIFDEWNMGCQQDTLKEITDGSVMRSSAKAASFCTAAMIVMNDSCVDIANYYEGTLATLHYGNIYNSYLEPAKPFYAFESYGKLYKSDRMRVNAFSEEPGVYVIANKKYVLISNYDTDGGNIIVECSNLCGKRIKSDIMTQDATHSLDIVRSEIYEETKNITLHLNLEKDSVALIKFEVF